MLNWIRKKQYEPPVETAAVTPCTELVDDLLAQLPEATGGELLERLEAFKHLCPEEQERELPATYLFLEQSLTDATGVRPGRAELRGRVLRRHEGLLALPGFRLIFEPEELQQLFLCRELLSTLLMRSREVLDAGGDGVLRDTLVWLADIPDRAPDPIPFDVAADPPRSTEEWIQLLTRMTHALYERVEQSLGRQEARRMFSGGYDELAERYLGLPAFSVVVGLLPEQVLDEDKIRDLDRGQVEQVVLDKVEHLQRVNARLRENNLQLGQAQQALEKANEDLEERVQERTELLRMANDNLRESEKKLRLITTAAHDAIVMLDDLGLVSFWNAAAERVFGYSRSEILGQDVCRHLVPRRFHSEFRQGLRRFAATGEATAVGETIEWRALGKHREEFPVELSLSSVEIQDRWHALAVVRDITERKRAEHDRRQLEERIQQNQRLESLGLLAGGIAHDFNNLLSAILGNAGLARQRTEASGAAPAVAENLAGIETAAARASDLTQQMLAYSGRGQFVVEPFDLSELVEEMRPLLDVSISKRADLRCELAAQLPAVEADRSQVQQVVMNLLTNASEALGDGHGAIVAKTGVLDAGTDELARLELGSELSPGCYVFFEVADTGCGMDGETRARIFDPFFSTKFVGRGLGLAAVLGIVRGHRGAIDVDSRPGEGTRFRVLFPASESALERPAPAPEAAAGRFGDVRGAGTVLVVDDEPAVRGMAEQALQILGFHVLSAEDGQQAVDLFRQRAAEIDLVLMDITMPKMDGREAFLKMRELHPDARVILSSGYSQQDALREMEGERPLGFLQKPYDLATLASEVTSALEGS